MSVLNKVMFKPTYLYIKTHNVTKLKYFGKTIQDPYTYKGSGVEWRDHLKENGEDVSTEIVGHYINEDECRNAALEFSIKNNIVNSSEWANVVVEDLAGGDTSQTENYIKSRDKRVKSLKLCKWWNNGTHQVFTASPPDNSYQRGRLPYNNKGALAGAKIQSKKLWVHNGITEMMIQKNLPIPDGFVNGRIKGFFSGRHSSAGTHWWTDSTQEKMSKESPGPNWTRGRLG